MEGARAGSEDEEGRERWLNFDGQTSRVELRGSNFDGGGRSNDDGGNKGGGGCEGGEYVKVGSL